MNITSFKINIMIEPLYKVKVYFYFRRNYMSQTNYLLDTNVIFNDPYVLNKFENCNIYIPGVVLEELDKHKNDPDLFMQVRIFSRILDKLHDNHNVTENHCQIIFMGESYSDSDLSYLGGRTNDNIIIHTAKQVNKNEDVTLLSNDMAVRIKARGLAHLVASGMTQELTDNTSQEFYKWLHSSTISIRCT
jgi:PhoH-like ATPase